MLKLSAAFLSPCARRSAHNTQRFRVRIKTEPPRFTRSPGVVHRAAQRKRGEPPSSFVNFHLLKAFFLFVCSPIPWKYSFSFFCLFRHNPRTRSASARRERPRLLSDMCVRQDRGQLKKLLAVLVVAAAVAHAHGQGKNLTLLRALLCVSR